MKMSIFYSVFLFFSASSLTAYAGIKTVANVDINRFAGTWYRIAANPIVFEPECACARQVLAPSQDGLLNVYNSCNKKDIDGKLVEIRGKAKPLDSTGSKLSVDFGLPWKGSYWVVALDSDYRYTVVTDKWGYSLYIMSKTPQLSEDLYLEAVQAAKNSNVKTNNLKWAKQAGCNYL